MPAYCNEVRWLLTAGRGAAAQSESKLNTSTIFMLFPGEGKSITSASHKAAGIAPVLFTHANIMNRHVAVHSLAHVVDRQ